MWKIICLWDIAIVYICVWHIGGSETRSEFSMVTRKTIKLQREFFFFLLLTWLHQNTGEGRKSCTILWQRRREEGAHGLFVCIPHPLDTQSGLYCVLQIYTQDVGLECFPGKKKEKDFFSSVCFHDQEWLRHTNKPLFWSSQMQSMSADVLCSTPAHICTFFPECSEIKRGEIRK